MRPTLCRELSDCWAAFDEPQPFQRRNVRSAQHRQVRAAVGYAFQRGPFKIREGICRRLARGLVHFARQFAVFGPKGNRVLPLHLAERLRNAGIGMSHSAGLALLKGGFKVIYAERGKQTAGASRLPDRHYKTMTTAEICALPIERPSTALRNPLDDLFSPVRAAQ